MSVSRRSLFLFSLTLVILCSGVFFSWSAHAESLPTPVNPLRQNEPVIEQASQIVETKQSSLNSDTNTIAKLLQVKEELSQKLQDIQGDVDALKAQVSAKKAAAAAEAARLEAIKNMFVHVNRYAFDAAGNNYAPGNCTWYVKNRRPDISNSWGNANTWYYRAAAQGWGVGVTPKKGAVGTTVSGLLGHVVYVEGVSLDGKWVTISEMNYGWVLYKMNTRTVYYTEFVYIYDLN